jgi:aspartate aminotransferase-like enzyme
MGHVERRSHVLRPRAPAPWTPTGIEPVLEGDKVIVCVAGKFGERWAEIAKAYGLDATVITMPYGQAVSSTAVAEALAKEPATKGVFVQASETSTGAAHDIQAMAKAIAKTDAIFVVDAITGLGTMPLDIDGWASTW